MMVFTTLYFCRKALLTRPMNHHHKNCTHMVPNKCTYNLIVKYKETGIKLPYYP